MSILRRRKEKVFSGSDSWCDPMKDPPSTVDIDPDMVAGFQKRSKILELACAHGRTAFYLEEQGHEVTGIDIDPESISEAKRIGKERGSTVKFMEADGRYLPFDDRLFDICVMNAFLTMLTDTDSRIRAITEAFRVTREGGCIYVADFLQTWDSPTYRERYETFEKITGEKGTFIVTDDGSMDGEGLYRAHHYTEEEITELLISRYEIIREELCEFTTYHGNRVNGIKLLACKKRN